MLCARPERINRQQSNTNTAARNVCKNRHTPLSCIYFVFLSRNGDSIKSSAHNGSGLGFDSRKVVSAISMPSIITLIGLQLAKFLLLLKQLCESGRQGNTSDCTRDSCSLREGERRSASKVQVWISWHPSAKNNRPGRTGGKAIKVH